MTGSKGVTLIELLIGMACFSIVVALVTGIFVTALSAKKQVKELSVLQDEARYIMDYMSREIRVAEITHIDNNKLELNGAINYQFSGDNILREGQALNTVNVSGNFSGQKNPKPGWVTINMTLISLKNPALSITIQTTISSRSYKL